jgi:hypothetical protein
VDLGDTPRFKADLTNGSGVLTNASSVTLTITLPDGTTATPTVSNPPAVTGQYFYDYQFTQLGRYLGCWLFTMAGGATTAHYNSFDVDSLPLVTTDEAVRHLRAGGIITSENDLEELQWLCMVAQDAIERDLGRITTRRTVVESHDGGVGTIILRKTPVLSVTSLTEGGVTVSPTYGYVLKTLADGGALVERGSQLVPQGFWWGRQNVVVTYVAGYTDPPRILRKVALNAIQGMWQESQQAFHPGLEDFSANAVGSATDSLTRFEMGAYESLRVHG